VLWFLSVAGPSGSRHTRCTGTTNAAVTALAVGLAVTVYSAALWLIRRRALQNVALFAGLVVTILGIADITVTVAGGARSARWLAFALALWVFGLAWAGLGWQRYVEPLWVTHPGRRALRTRVTRHAARAGLRLMFSGLEATRQHPLIALSGVPVRDVTASRIRAGTHGDHQATILAGRTLAARSGPLACEPVAAHNLPCRAWPAPGPDCDQLVH
jgi:hypothetical protein